jgi:biopolymer transport protein TolQ
MNVEGNQSLLLYIFNASLVVQLVMLLLMVASIVSWTFIFQRASFLKSAQKSMKDFEKRFWSTGDLTVLYNQIDKFDKEKAGLSGIFYAGFKEFLRLKRQPKQDNTVIMEGVQRAMRIAYAHEQEELEAHLPFLASVGSTSPYVGLFGTVWGIMSTFQALSSSTQQATIAMVAPGISEALIATAMGLFAAIPAVLAYNRYSNQAERLMNNYETFQEEFSNILHRETHSAD